MAPLGVLETLAAHKLQTRGLIKLITQRAQIAFLMAICVMSVLSLLTATTTASDASRSSLCELLNREATQSSDAEFSLGLGQTGAAACLDSCLKRHELVQIKPVLYLVANNSTAPHHLVSLSGHFRPTTLIEMPEHLKVLSGTPPPA
jgi:hypothetical protein